MSVDILIATRENPTALASLLASVIAASDPFQVRNQRVHISDSSREPVIFNQQVARCLPLLDVHYRHTIVPSVNAQRMAILQELPPQSVVLSVDDDLVLLEGHLRAANAMAPNVRGGSAYFGVTVDATNERGYPDYDVFTDKPKDNHTFSDGLHAVFHAPCLGDFSASVGHMLVSARRFRDTLALTMQTGQPSEIADDACATLIARATGKSCHAAMRAWHVGNSNKWFVTGKWNSKRDRVMQVVLSLEEKLASGQGEAK